MTENSTKCITEGLSAAFDAKEWQLRSIGSVSSKACGLPSWRGHAPVNHWLSKSQITYG
jgi:hypothetical protein